MRQKFRKIILGCALLLLALVISLVVQIDDWSRDLTTNYAATSADADDPLLRTWECAQPPEKVEQVIADFVLQNSAWNFADSSKEFGVLRLSLTRTTRFLRFVDDVQIILQTSDNGTQVDITSRSRLGKGDLGQNPRNIRELMQALQEVQN